jgi:hypothetical protein
MSGSFHVNLDLSSLMVLKILEYFSYIDICKTSSLLWPHFTHRVPEFNKLDSELSGRFHVNFYLVSTKIFKYFFFYYLSTCTNIYPYYGPTRPPMGMILIKMDFYYLRKLSCKCELFWSSSSS